MKRLISCISVMLLLSSLIFSAEGALNTEIGSDYEKAVITARTEIWKKINSGGTGSGAVAIMDHSQLVYFEGFAMADRENSLKVDETTVFNIASVSKVFAAAAIMLLVDDGKIDLDEPVCTYLPELTSPDPRYAKITVRMLLNHTSGLAGSTMANNCGYEYNVTVNDQILKNIKSSNLTHEPGAVAVYCNDGFALAEMVVQKISGKSYINFLKEEIFEPLNLEQTGMTAKAKEKGIPAAYYDVSSGEREPQEIISSLGAGGLNSTVIDLCRFADCFSDEGNILFSQLSLEELMQHQPADREYPLKNPAMSYGLGWDYTSMPEYEKEGIQVIGKSGASLNYAAMLLTIPELRLCVAVIETGSDPEAPAIAERIMKQVLIGKGLIEKAPEEVSIPVESEPLPNEYKAYEGYYAGNSGSLSQVMMDEKNHTVNIYSFSDGQMVPAISFFYKDGCLYDESTGDNQCYFATFDEHDYFVYSSFGMDCLYMEKLQIPDDPQSLLIDIDGVKWLRRNVKPYEYKDLQYTHIKHSHILQELPGYCFFNTIVRITSPTSADFAASTARDQKDLKLIKNNDSIWAKTSDMIYSPADDLTLFKGETTSVTIGSQGYNEWRMTDMDAVMMFTIPETSRVVVFSPKGTPVYDSLKYNRSIFVEQGSLIELIGYDGDTFVIQRTLE